MSSAFSRAAAPGVVFDVVRRLQSAQRQRKAAAAQLAQLPGSDSLLARFKWLCVLTLVVLLMALCVLRSVARPLLGLIVAPGRYGRADCAIDVVIVLFFVFTVCYGVYVPTALLPLPLYKWRPTPRRTPLHLLMANAVLVLMLSFSLPIVVWMLGIGSKTTMGMIAAHYGHISVLHNRVVTRGYVLLLIAVAVWLVAVKAKQRLSAITAQLWRRDPYPPNVGVHIHAHTS